MLKFPRLIEPIDYGDEFELLKGCAEFANHANLWILRTSGAENSLARKVIMRWIRAQAYCLIRYVLADEDRIDLLKSLVPDEPHDGDRKAVTVIYRNEDENEAFGDDYRGLPLRRGPLGRKSDHRVLLKALFVDRPKTLNSSYVHRFACQIEYADWHRIPLHFLDGFLLDVGIKAVLERVGSSCVEPKYEQWVAHQLVKEDVSDDQLAAYPKTMRARVAQLKARRKEGLLARAALYYFAARGEDCGYGGVDGADVEEVDEIATLIEKLCDDPKLRERLKRAQEWD